MWLYHVTFLTPSGERRKAARVRVNKKVLEGEVRQWVDCAEILKIERIKKVDPNEGDVFR